MEYWYDIVAGYDDPKSKNPTLKKNDSTYSQFSVVIILIYLIFGDDYPYNIEKYFKDKFYSNDDQNTKMPYCSNLRTSKVSTLLKKMEEDGLVTVREEKGKTRPRKVYSLNPRIIQSPIRDATYILPDRSIFEIPPEMIKQILPWVESPWEMRNYHIGRDGFFDYVNYPQKIDFLLFIKVLIDYASRRRCIMNLNFYTDYLHTPDTTMDRGRFVRIDNSSPLVDLLEEYYDEVIEYINNKEAPNDQI